MLVRSTAGFRPQVLYRPESIAVLGAGTRAGAAMVARIKAAGFAGPVQLVDDAQALGAAPDLAVLCLKPAAIGAALAGLAAKGGHAAIVPGPAPDLAALSAATGVRVLGESSFGLAIPSLALDATRGHVKVPEGRIALLCQSTAIANALLDWAGPNGAGFSLIVGIGTNAGLGFGHALDWLARDSGTGAVLLDIRRIKDRRAFLSAARAAARLRPVVALRPGSTADDADAAFDAALRRAGVLRVSGLTELLAAAETLPRAPRARADTLLILSDGLGLSRLAADAACRQGVALATLDQAAWQAVSVLLPDGSIADNPLFVPAPATRLAEVAAMLSAVLGIGGVLVIRAPGAEAAEAGDAALAALAHRPRVPLLACLPGESTAARSRRTLAAAGLPAFATPEEAVAAFAMLLADRRNRLAAAELPPRDVLAVAPDRAAVAAILDRARQTGRPTLEEDEALSVLAAYGIPVVPTRIAADAAAAQEAATALGFPVVLKVRSPDLPHKTEAGGVVLDLHDAASVAEAAAAIAARVAAARPDARRDGFVVQRMVPGAAQELLVRVADDPMFGPVITFGHGGTAARLVDDCAHDLPPLNISLARALIGRTRVARLLAGYRDHRPADQEAVADALVRVSQLVVDFPEIASLDLNPLRAGPDGVLALDAGLALHAGGVRSMLAIAPYPAELAREWTDRQGETVLVRPIRPEDAEAHAAFFARLDPESVRFRFFSVLRQLSPEQIARMTQVDYDREMAFIATRDGHTLGVARAVREPGSEDCEFAVIVQPDRKGRGLAKHLMQRLIDWARVQGMRAMVGLVLAENTPMLGFSRALGFSTRRVPDEEDVVEARLSLREERA